MITSFNSLNFTVFDFETNGIDPRTNQVIEACVIRVRNGEPVSVYNTLVALNEGQQLAPKITELTGHTVEDLVNGITEEALFHILAYMIPEDEMLVAYNGLFDMSFLAYGLKKYEFLIDEIIGFDNPFIDPLTIARNRDPFPHKLEDSCKRHGIELDDAHSAYADTFALLDLVLDQHEKKDISEWINIAGYRPKYGEPEWYPQHAKIIKQGSEVVEHSKKSVPIPRKAPPVTITRNSNRKKAVPDDPKS